MGDPKSTKPTSQSKMCVTRLCLALAVCIVHCASVPDAKHRYFGRRWGNPSPPPKAIYVDGASGKWTTGQTYSTVKAAVGDSVIFRYNKFHNVWQVKGKEAYDACSFTGASSLASTSLGGGDGDLSNKYSYKCRARGNVYIACQVGAHCSNGQKVTIACGASTTSGVRKKSSLEWTMVAIVGTLMMMNWYTHTA